MFEEGNPNLVILLFLLWAGLITLLWTLLWFLGKSGYLLYARPEQRNIRNVVTFLLCLVGIPSVVLMFLLAAIGAEPLDGMVINVFAILFYSTFIVLPILGARSGMKSN